EFAVDDVVQAAVVAEHQNHVGGLHAGLEADAAAGELDEHRIGPAAIGHLHRHQTMAPTTADHQTGLDRVGNDDDRAAFVEQLVRNGLLGDVLDLTQYAHRIAGTLVFLRAGNGVG